jgi:GntR family transcriptional regulator, transcriptional repressor for pyruvate dehydrogenase complex
MFKRISPKKISDEIIEQFKALLSRGELKPGDELPAERELAELIGVSRPPLREALNALQAMGFIEIRPRSKILVKSIAENSLRDPLTALIGEDTGRLFELLEIRGVMEGWTASAAAERGTPADIAKLEAIIRKDQQNLRKGIDDARTDADFHVTISLAAHNTLLSHLIASFYHLLWDTQKMSRKKIFQKKENRTRIAEQHRSILDAIKAKDSRRASEEAKKHVAFVASEFREAITSSKTAR